MRHSRLDEIKHGINVDLWRSRQEFSSLAPSPRMNVPLRRPVAITLLRVNCRTQQFSAFAPTTRPSGNVPLTSPTRELALLLAGTAPISGQPRSEILIATLTSLTAHGETSAKIVPSQGSRSPQPHKVNYAEQDRTAGYDHSEQEIADQSGTPRLPVLVGGACRRPSRASEADERRAESSKRQVWPRPIA